MVEVENADGTMGEAFLLKSPETSRSIENSSDLSSSGYALSECFELQAGFEVINIA